MARPRVFVSSTFYDLKHVRASLEVFIESLGYEAVLFEKGDIAFHPDSALDISCYREAESADIFVLIIGGRYGSQTSDTLLGDRPQFFDQYKSITEKEFETAQSVDVPTFIAIDRAVHSEYQTFLKNKNNKNTNYAHVDSVNVFKLIETIFSKNKNNPVFSFERASDISSWLRDQWSGLFRELLRARSQQRQLSALNAQVHELQSINETLKKYLEVVLGRVAPDASQDLIKSEHEKIEKDKQDHELLRIPLFRFLMGMPITEKQAIRSIFEDAEDAEDALKRYDIVFRDTPAKAWLKEEVAAQEEFNYVRKILGKPQIIFESEGKISSK